MLRRGRVTSDFLHHRRPCDDRSETNTHWRVAEIRRLEHRATRPRHIHGGSQLTRTAVAGHRVDSRAGGRISRGLSPKSEVNQSIVWLQASESMPQSSAAFRIASRNFVFSPGPLTISKKFGSWVPAHFQTASDTKVLYELDLGSERQRLLDRASNCGSSSGPCPGFGWNPISDNRRRSSFGKTLWRRLPLSQRNLNN